MYHATKGVEGFGEAVALSVIGLTIVAPGGAIWR